MALFVDVAAPPEDVAAVAAEWLDACWDDVLTDEVRAALLATTKALWLPSEEADDAPPVGAAGELFALLTWAQWRGSKIRSTHATFTRAGLIRLPSQLDRGCFWLAWDIDRLSEDVASMTTLRLSGHGTSPSALSIEVVIDDEAPGWIRLSAATSLGALLDDATAPDRWLSALRRMTASRDVVFGYLGFSTRRDTLWEVATVSDERPGWPQVRSGRETARGVGWATVVGRGLADRIDAESSTPIPRWPNGHGLVLAGSDFSSYDRVAARRAREIVRPVLSAAEVDALLLAQNLHASQRVSSTWMLGLDDDPLDLRYAAAIDDAEAVLALAARGVPLEARDAHGFTALHLACRTGSVESVRALLKAGADPRATSGRGLTPLHDAIRAARGATDPDRPRALSGASAEILRLLMDAGADRDQPDASGTSPRDLAARITWFDVSSHLDR